MTNADLNIVSGGETNLPLSKLLQEIEILMTAERQTLINNYNKNKAIDKFLFKYSVNEQIVASSITTNIYENCYIPDNFDVNVEVQFVNGRGTKDIMYIEIQVTYQGKYKEKLIYNIGSDE